MDTLDYSLRMAGTGGSAKDGALANKTDITYQIHDMIQILNDQLKIQDGSFDELHKKVLEYREEQTHLPAILPIAENDLIMISTDFGLRTDPFFFISRVHNGLDFVAPPGKKVFATGDGIVTFVEYSRKGYGNEIVINHTFGFSSRYAHLSTIKVKKGDRIRRGQIIGTVGQTGRATVPHLHYEVLLNGKAVNPSYYFDTNLTREEYAQIVNSAN
jgi:murein DD-endopeptidase MepM/ murein hydrolase activator NlpD